MASKLWYPPIVNDSEPAFIEKARIYFSFNKYNIADLSNLSIADNKITNLMFRRKLKIIMIDIIKRAFFHSIYTCTEHFCCT